VHMIEHLDWAARNFPDRPAFSGSGGEMTYEAAQAMTNRIARALVSDGFEIGSRFAVLGPNSTPLMIAMLGAMRAGGAWCNVNMRAALDSNVEILHRGRCEALLFHSSVAHLVPAFEDAIPGLRRVMCVDSETASHTSLVDWSSGESGAWLDRPIPLDSLGFQGTTGGTTGAPKLTQASNQYMLMSTLAWTSCWHFDSPPVNLAVAPITHASGMVAFAQFQFGGTTIFMDTPDLDVLLDLIESQGVTTLFLPPTLIYALLAHPRLASTDTHTLRYVISAAAPIAPERLIEGVQKLGPVMCQAFGQTESGFPLTWISPAEIVEAIEDESRRDRLLSCGRPTMNGAIEAMGEDGRVLFPGEVGEIVLRCPTTMTGYLDDEAATTEAQAFGWHHTGDIGYRDRDGYVYLTDRKRDLILSGGFNVFPFEVESVLIAHPAVQDCAVIGVPHEKWGEAVKACVQLKPAATVSADELIATCKVALGSVKAPKSIDFVDDLPRSPVGKVLKRELRAPYWSGRERQIG
jgi:fatty-acyl-CoA synthase